MPATDRSHGQYGQILADPSGGGSAVQLVSLDKYDLDLTADTQRTTCFEDPNHTYVRGKPDIKFSFNGQYDKSVAGLTLFDMLVGTVDPYFKLIPNRLFPLQFFGGLAIVNGMKVSVDANGGVTTSGSGMGSGAWVFPIDPA
jgi:hypothetical protein